jgi:hypothetical protein
MFLRRHFINPHAALMRVNRLDPKHLQIQVASTEASSVGDAAPTYAGLDPLDSRPDRPHPCG